MRQPGTRGRRRGQRGLSLIETVCAAAVLAIGIAGLANLSATSAALHQTGTQKTAAMRAIESQLATVTASDFATMQADWNGDGFTVVLEGKTGELLRALVQDGDGMPGQVTVTAPTGDPAELLEVQVQIDWQSPHGPQSLARRMRVSRLGSGP